MTIRERLERFVGRWEASLASEFLQYTRLLEVKSSRFPKAWGETRNEPYWKELPHWLIERYCTAGHAPTPEFLESVLWGQTCLFYAVRLQDDLLDGEISRSPLAFASLMFLAEADRTFAEMMDATAVFWRYHPSALQTTIAGIVRLANMQRDPQVPTEDLLNACGSVDAIFCIGASAVCERIGLIEAVPRLEVFVRELGKVLLTLDDIADLDEDLADGRLTYPARVLLHGRIGNKPDPILLAKSWRQFKSVEAYDLIRITLLGCLDQAESQVVALGLQQAKELIRTTRFEVQEIGR